MSTRVLISLALLFGAIAFASTLSLYVYGGGFDNAFSSEAQDWGAFGSYFGGVLGPLMGFGSVILLVTTILQQELQLKRLYKEHLKHSHLRYFDALHEDIKYVMQRKLPDGNGNYFDFGDMVLGTRARTTSDSALLNALVSQLLRLASEYSEALALYRKNIDTYFEFKAHRARVEMFAEFLEGQNHLFEQDQRITLGSIHNHLSGNAHNKSIEKYP